MTAATYNKLGRITALVSFLIGTGIYVILLINNDFNFLSFALSYLVLAFIINIIILLFVLAKVVTDEENRDELFKTALWMLLNIPIVILYFFIGITIG